MMQTLFAVLIAIWVGVACGAITDNVVPGFWNLWFGVGLVLGMTTSVYIHHRRVT